MSPNIHDFGLWFLYIIFLMFLNSFCMYLMCILHSQLYKLLGYCLLFLLYKLLWPVHAKDFAGKCRGHQTMTYGSHLTNYLFLYNPCTKNSFYFLNNWGKKRVTFHDVWQLMEKFKFVSTDKVLLKHRHALGLVMERFGQQYISSCDVSEVLSVLAELGLYLWVSVICHEVAAVCLGGSWSQSERPTEHTWTHLKQSHLSQCTHLWVRNECLLLRVIEFCGWFIM